MHISAKAKSIIPITTSTVTIASKRLTNASGSVMLTNPTPTVTDAL